MNKLEIDSSILERNLKFKDIHTEDDEFNKLLQNIQQASQGGIPDDNVSSTIIHPTPGLCIKFFTEDGKKHFINLCHHHKVPAPKFYSDDELMAKLASNEDTTSYRIPMSISEMHMESDKSGSSTPVYDIAVATSVIQTMEKQELFRSFIMVVLLEALQEKFKIKVDMSQQRRYIILQNRKSLGKIKQQRIPMKETIPAGPLIQEVSHSSSSAKKSITKPQNTKLKLELHPAKGSPKYLVARIRVRAQSEKDIILDIGEDRIVLASARIQEPFLDIFLPYNIIQEETTAEYFRFAQELKIHMPIAGAV